MSILKLLSTCALSQIMGDSADNVLGMLGDRVGDRSRLIIGALQDASQKAWKAVEISLAGESLWSKLDSREDKAFRQQIRNLLDNMQLPLLAVRKEFPQLCLQELRLARNQGLLLNKLTPDELKRSVGMFARQGDQAAILAHERAAVQEMVAILERERFNNLAWLIGQEVENGCGLLVLAVQYYFRRAVETSPELARSLEFTRLEQLSEAQAAGFRQLEQLARAHEKELEQLLGGVCVAALDTHDAVLDLAAEQRQHSEQLADLSRQVQQLMEQKQQQGMLGIAPPRHLEFARIECANDTDQLAGYLSEDHGTASLPAAEQALPATPNHSTQSLPGRAFGN